MRIAICDDDVLFQKRFTKMIREWDPTQCLECFSTGAELLRAAAGGAFDLVFLDIYFPEENGLDVAARLQKVSPETSIVFLTVSEDCAVDAWSVNALHYLVKPVTAEGVEEAFRRLARLRSRPRRILTLPVDHDSVTVYLDEVTYIVSDGHAKNVCLTSGQTLRVRMHFHELEDKLDDTFLKLNKGTIVNMEHIRTMSKDYCLLRDGTKLTFTRRGRRAIEDTYEQFMYSRLFGEKNGG